MRTGLPGTIVQRCERLRHRDAMPGAELARQNPQQDVV
jgi:hypothetical protein